MVLVVVYLHPPAFSTRDQGVLLVNSAPVVGAPSLPPSSVLVVVCSPHPLAANSLITIMPHPCRLVVVRPTVLLASYLVVGVFALV